MSTSAIFKQSSNTMEIPQPFSLKWDEFDLLTVKLKASGVSGIVENQLLRGTHLSCTITSEVGQWKNRKIFTQTILTDIIAKCPKDEPLAFISLGADRLLIEYILGKSLIENGFRQISFFLIDPIYVFSESENIKEIQEVLKDFRKHIESVYFSNNKEHFAPERIRYLPRSQNIDKYFPKDVNPNVVVIESLPPYSEIIKDMQKYHVEEKNTQDLLSGGYIVQSSHANAVAFLPKQYAEQLRISGAKLKDSLPLAIFKSAQSYFYIDWGCKIRSDGTYYLSFSCEEQYLKSLNISKDRQIKLATGEVVQAGQWIPTVKKSIEKALTEKIESIKGGNSQKQLSQENLTALLEKVKEIAAFYMPGISYFFSADYILDRDAAMTFIASHASHHYRKIFSLTADVNMGYRISIDEIK
jgi:hypothetical protein